MYQSMLVKQKNLITKSLVIEDLTNSPVDKTNLFNDGTYKTISVNGLIEVSGKNKRGIVIPMAGKRYDSILAQFYRFSTHLTQYLDINITINNVTDSITSSLLLNAESTEFNKKKNFIYLNKANLIQLISEAGMTLNNMSSKDHVLVIEYIYHDQSDTDLSPADYDIMIEESRFELANLFVGEETMFVCDDNVQVKENSKTTLTRLTRSAVTYVDKVNKYTSFDLNLSNLNDQEVLELLILNLDEEVAFITLFNGSLLERIAYKERNEYIDGFYFITNDTYNYTSILHRTSLKCEEWI